MGKPNLGPPLETLRQLLKNVKVALAWVSERVLELLSHCAFDLHQLDMCGVVAPERGHQGFFSRPTRNPSVLFAFMTLEFLG